MAKANSITRSQPGAEGGVPRSLTSQTSRWSSEQVTGAILKLLRAGADPNKENNIERDALEASIVGLISSTPFSSVFKCRVQAASMRQASAESSDSSDGSANAILDVAVKAVCLNLGYSGSSCKQLESSE